MMKNFFLMVFILSGIGFAQDAKFDSLVNTGIHQIYNIQFTEAEVTFRKVIADYPAHPAGRFFLAMIDWWKILLDLDVEVYDEDFFDKLEDVIYFCDDILDNDSKNVDALFFKGGAIGFRGRVRALRESWLKAADDGREALPIVQRAAKLNPDNKDVQLGFGIYNYYAAVIPAKHPYLKPVMIFFPSGDKELGLRQLNETADFGKYAKFEALYFLMTLHFQFENNAYKADEYADRLVGLFPNNPVFLRWKGRIVVRKGENDKSAEIFKQVYQGCVDSLPGFNDKSRREAAYYIGLNFKNNYQADSSRIYFEECETLSRKMEKGDPSGFLINTVLYLGMMNDALGQRSKAVDYYNEVLRMKEYGQSHQFAKDYLKTPFKY